MDDLNDLISRGAAIAAALEGADIWDGGCSPNRDECITMALNKVPRVDAARFVNGRWVRAHGYVTPGGDPVWKCSECGKGIHTYGVEHGSYGVNIADGQWVSCPNCGAKMDSEDWRSA